MAKSKPRAASADALRSPCPVAATLDLIGDKWTLLIVRDLLAGKTRYKDLAASPERIATNTLASRLEKLAETGLVSTAKCDAHAGATEYHLTDAGRSLIPVLRAMRDWGLSHVPGTEALVKVSDAGS